MMFRWFWNLIFIHSTYSFDLYRTDRSLYIKNNYHTCFYFHMEEWYALDIKTRLSAFIPHCIRNSLVDNREEEEEQCNGELYTFEYMYKHKWTSSKLVNMGAPYDVIDNYQNYIDNHQLINQQLYYCHCENEQSFGLQCQYTFISQYNYTNFQEYLAEFFIFKMNWPIESMYEITNDTCYIDMNCTTNSLCLQWNEICDGKRDCFNGEDEQNCSIFELLECDEDYRCLNGFHCVPKEFTFDFYPDCTDGSDEMFDKICNSKYIRSECADIHCGWDLFSCGDGECIDFEFESNDPEDEHCSNRRDWYYIQNLLIKSDTMNESCWKSILCLFGLEKYFTSDIKECVYKFDDCPELIRFPFTKYFYLNYHVYFLYEKKTLINNTQNIISPDYICYDENQCPKLCSINEIIMHDIYTCCPNKFRTKYKKKQWQNLYHQVYFLFDERCLSIYYPQLNFNKTTNCSTTLFHCRNTQECISRHRVYDGFENCYDGYDENDYLNTCELNIPNRFQCSISKHQCIPKYFLLNDVIDCLDESDEKLPEKCSELFQTTYACDFIRGTTSFPIYNYVFKDICNGLVQHQYENETDETDCHLWPCASPSTLCNTKWDCSNGLDEVNCHLIYKSNGFEESCQLNEHICIDVLTRNWSCLSLNRAGDQSIDCIGGIDEQYNNSCSNNKNNRFQCYNSTKCISSNKLCDGINDCRYGDDEDAICPWIKTISSNCMLKKDFLCRTGTCLSRKHQCDGTFHCPGKEDEWFCWYYTKQVPYKNALITSRIDRNLFEIDITNYLWFCNFGYPIYSVDKKTIKTCLCPPNFYGKRCEYQSNRVILTHQIDIPAYLENQMMKFVFFLYNINTTEILDYDEIVHLSLRTTFHPTKYIIYLLYPHKKIKNHQNDIVYGIRINAYFVTIENIELKCAWLFPIPIYMNILPVQRIVSRLIFDVQRLYFQCSSKKYCSSNGLCKQYMNEPNLFYCHCYQQWFGNQCQFQIPLTFSSICSKDSLAIYDLIHNKSICICPLSKLGPTCHVPRSIDRCYDNESKCKNDGICSLVDVRDLNRNIICLCSEKYGGQTCQSKSYEILLKLSHSLFLNKDLSAIIYYIIEFVPPNKTVMSSGKYHTEEEEISFNLYIKATKLITNNFRSISPIYTRSIDWINENLLEEIHYLSLIQVYFNNFTEHLYYYNHNYINVSIKRIEVSIGIDRCLSVEELFNSTILEYHPLKRLKYYHQPCIHNLTKCFYDKVYLCLCNNRYKFSTCYLFSFNRSQCLTNTCQNQGKCLQDDERSNALNYKCLCRKCYHGKLCQYSTSDYSLSLDVLISEDLNRPLNISIFQQSFIIQLCFYIIITFVVLGFIFNLLTFITFCQVETRQTGSGIYLLILSIINQLDLILLLIRYLFLIQFETKFYLCKFLEYFAKLFPSISDWLSTFVTIERAYSVFIGLKFNKQNSQKFAKILILFLILIQSIVYLHEFRFRQVIQDLLDFENNRLWCVITFDDLNWIKNYNIIINIFNIISPFLCNLICASFIIIKISLSHLKIQQSRTFLIILYNQFIKHKHILISTLLLILLNLPRLFFMFIFTCFNSSLQWQKYFSLITYFLSFMPRLLTFFLFVQTSELYRNAMKLFFRNIFRYRS